jgi:hypothetical protein
MHHNVGVVVDVHVLVDRVGFLKFKKQAVKRTPENVKLLLPPRQSRGGSQRFSATRDYRGRDLSLLGFTVLSRSGRSICASSWHIKVHVWPL